MNEELKILLGEPTGWHIRLEKWSIQLWNKKMCRAELRVDTKTLWLDVSLVDGANPPLSKNELFSFKTMITKWFGVENFQIRNCQPLPRSLFLDLTVPFAKPIQLLDEYWYNEANDSQNPKWVQRICHTITDDEAVGTIYNNSDHHIWCTKHPELYAQ